MFHPLTPTKSPGRGAKRARNGVYFRLCCKRLTGFSLCVKKNSLCIIQDRSCGKKYAEHKETTSLSPLPRFRRPYLGIIRVKQKYADLPIDKLAAQHCQTLYLSAFVRRKLRLLGTRSMDNGRHGIFLLSL